MAPPTHTAARCEKPYVLNGMRAGLVSSPRDTQPARAERGIRDVSRDGERRVPVHDGRAGSERTPLSWSTEKAEPLRREPGAGPVAVRTAKARPGPTVAARRAASPSLPAARSALGRCR